MDIHRQARTAWLVLLPALVSCATQSVAPVSGGKAIQMEVGLAPAEFDSAAVCDPLGSVTPLFSGNDTSWKTTHLVEAEKSYIYAHLALNSYQREGKMPLPDSITEVQSIEDPRTGFAVTVFEITPRDTLKTVVLAFRGTEGGPLGLDWRYGNIMFTQNRQAVAFYDTMRKQYSDSSVRFVATGHSLGGGLALQVSIIHRDVPAWMFNGSYHIYRPKTTVNGVYRYHEAKNDERHSVTSYGEALVLVRGLLPNPTTLHTSGFVCTDVGGPFYNHSMERLARCLTHVAAIRRVEAREDLRRISVSCLSTALGLPADERRGLNANRSNAD